MKPRSMKVNWIWASRRIDILGINELKCYFTAKETVDKMKREKHL